MGLSLYTPETGGLKLAAAEGCGPDSLYRVGLMLDGKETHHGWVFQNQKAIVRRDLQKEMEFKIEQHNCLEGIRSYCAVPLVTRGHSFGRPDNPQFSKEPLFPRACWVPAGSLRPTRLRGQIPDSILLKTLWHKPDLPTVHRLGWRTSNGSNGSQAQGAAVGLGKTRRQRKKKKHQLA
jgi:hypothetical protein